MDMFSNYQVIPETYTPCNTHNKAVYPKSYTALTSDSLTKPFEVYDAKGNLEGFAWNYGDVVELSFDITGFLVVEDDSEQFYEDLEEFLADKDATFSLYDFRNTALYVKTIPASSNIEILIDKELSSKLVKGVYTCQLVVTGTHFQQTVFDNKDCEFLVR